MLICIGYLVGQSTVQRHAECSAALQACIARLMLCVRRLEQRGDVVAMDPAVLEEMLHHLAREVIQFNVVCVLCSCMYGRS